MTWGLPDTMNGIELVWSAFNLIGIWASGRLLLRTWRKRRAMLNPSEEARAVRVQKRLTGMRLAVAVRIAHRNFRDEGAKYAWHVAGIVVGIWALTQPDRAGDVEVISVLAGWLLVGMSGLLALSSVLNLRDDDWIDEAFESSRHPTETAP